MFTEIKGNLVQKIQLNMIYTNEADLMMIAITEF